jgi:hypothetical protein
VEKVWKRCGKNPLDYRAQYMLDCLFNTWMLRHEPPPTTFIQYRRCNSIAYIAYIAYIGERGHDDHQQVLASAMKWTELVLGEEYILEGARRMGNTERRGIFEGKHSGDLTTATGETIVNPFDGWLRFKSVKGDSIFFTADGREVIEPAKAKAAREAAHQVSETAKLLALADARVFVENLGLVVSDHYSPKSGEVRLRADHPLDEEWEIEIENLYVSDLKKALTNREAQA